MKSAIIICVVVAVNGVYGHTVQLTQTQKENVAQYTAECIEKTGVKPEILADAKKGEITDDETLKKFTLCFFEKAGIVDHDGKLNIEVALTKLPPGVDKAEAQKVLEECNKKNGTDAAETAFEIYKCYRQNISTPASLGI